MDQDELIRAILTALIVGVILPMTLWYFGVRTNRPQLKVIGVAVAVFYFVVAGLDLGNRWFGLFEETTFRTGVLGPARRDSQPSVIRETPYYVKHFDRKYLLELLPVAKIGEQSVGSLTVRYEVRSPSGELLASGAETVQPAKADKWATIHAEFPTHEEGVHKVIVEVPKPAGEIKLTIREVKR